MLGFFSSSNDHPLADAAAARTVLAELAGRDPHGAVDEALAWIESLQAAADFKPAQRLERLLQLDEAVAPQARRLGRDYLQQGGANRSLQNRLWETCHGYWLQLAEAYGAALEAYRRGDKGVDALRPQLPPLYLRRLIALAACLKWEQLRYGPVRPELWAALGTTYLAAESEGCATRALPLGGGNGSSEAEYLKTLVFQAASMDKLTPLEIELAERLVSHFLPCFSLTRELRPESVYWVDCAKAQPPARLARVPEVTPTLRFFSGGRAVEAIEATLARIRADHAVPPSINLGGQYEPDAVVAVLEHLAVCWAPTPPTRNHARRRIASGLAVAHGLQAAYRWIDGQVAPGAALEQWQVEDVSLGGMGAQAPVMQYDWIRIGSLLAIRPEGGDNWLLGVVRRYARTAETCGAVGIETLSRTPRAVLADSGGLQTEALLLGIPVVGEYARMALAADALEDKVALSFPLDGKGARLHPREIVERGEDYVIASFFVQSFS